MLPKKRRIKRGDFPYLISKGRRYNTPHLLLYVVKMAENKANSATKVSFSVSKKVCSKAVDRNKLRRRGYSIISSHISEIQPNFECFFVFKKDSLDVSFKALEDEILELLSTALVIK